MSVGSRRRAWLGAVAAACVVVSAGCAGPRPEPPPEPVLGDRPEYRIGAGDQLRIVVWKNAELGVDAPVRPDGRISVPLVDDVQAEGLTPEELGDLIAAELEEFVSAPTVSVVVQRVDKRVFIVGEVARPGAFPLSQQLRLMDLITMAGGFREFADRGDVQVIRATSDGEVTYPFDYDAYVKGDAPGTNLVLEPGDVVVVSD